MYYRNLYFKYHKGRSIRGKLGPQYRCVCCKKWFPKNRITVDHIIPLRKGGINCLGNLQPMCRPCNSSKGPRVTRREVAYALFHTAMEFKLFRLLGSMAWRKLLDLFRVPYRRDN